MSKNIIFLLFALIILLYVYDYLKVSDYDISKKLKTNYPLSEKENELLENYVNYTTQINNINRQSAIDNYNNTIKSAKTIQIGSMAVAAVIGIVVTILSYGTATPIVLAGLTALGGAVKVGGTIAAKKEIENANKENISLT
jgi:ABC-type transport system involved in Fe-S cluster assembly fused permease/ATPase subunit